MFVYSCTVAHLLCLPREYIGADGLVKLNLIEPGDIILNEMQGYALKTVARLRSSLSLLSNIARYRSTPSFFVKCKDNGAPQQPSKTHVRYSVRHKRADAKRALNDLLTGKVSSQHFQDDDNYQRSSNSGRSKSQKSYYGKGKQNKRWQKKKIFLDDDEHKHPEITFTANFGGQQSFTWSFYTWENSTCQNSAAGFQDDTKSEKYRGRIWSESDLEDDVNDEDLYSDRIALGLPASGPLCLDDVKRAFHKIALKWHPDKHHGIAQAMAAEKFKLCVDAYKNLCSALKSS